MSGTLGWEPPGGPGLFGMGPAPAMLRARGADRDAVDGRQEQEARLAAGMTAAQAGDAGAYRRLLAECAPLLAAVARGLGLRGDAVDDAVQDALLTVHRVRHTYDPARPFLPWLRAIGRRRAIDQLRRRGRRGAREVHDPVAHAAAPDPGPAPDHGLELRERGRLLAAAVATLPAAQRQAVEQLALAQRSLDQATVATGRSRGALKVNLHRALRALRDRLRGGEG